MTEPGMVIVGGGEAGARAALALRAQGWAGPVTVVGAEPWAPYERPPLSKAVLTGADEPVPATIPMPGVTVLLGTPVTAIDRAGHRLTLADGRLLPYARLLLATGARLRRLPAPDIAYLRTWHDALWLRHRLRPGLRLAVVGGGVIGLEVAASAAQRGCAVTVIEAAPRLLGRCAPAEIADLVADRHRAAGVALRLGTGVEAIDGTTVTLIDGSTVAADLVVAGIGVTPETGLAEAAGLAIDNGIRADHRLATADPDIFAAGDCCSAPHPLFGGRRLRLETWRNTGDQAAVAAANMLGGDRAWDAVPWFWSDQFELCLQVAGLPDAGAETVARPLAGARLLFHLDPAGQLVGASAFGPLEAIARDVRVAEMLIARGACPDPDALASPAMKLKSLLAGV